jgi:hypothetical protein
MCDRRHLNRAGSQEAPNAADIALSEVENFCEHSFGPKKWQSAIVVGLDARSVPFVAAPFVAAPFVAAIDECENGAGVNSPTAEALGEPIGGDTIKQLG